MVHANCVNKAGLRIGALVLALGALLCTLPRQAMASVQDEFKKIVWTTGPATVDIGGIASINLPQGYRFTDAAGAAIWDHLNQNPHGNELGILLPPPDTSAGWFMTFNFDAMGYVKDDEKIDDAAADSILKSIRTNTEASNDERRRNGWETLTVVGWDQKPFYDSATHHLTWAIRGRASGGSESVNYDSRVLGRHGVLRVRLVDEPSKFAASVPTYNSLVTSIDFKSGERYSEYRSGDQIAKYGLVGLITGGAAVAAVKFWKPLMKLGAVIVAGIGAVFVKIKRFFTRGKA